MLISEFDLCKREWLELVFVNRNKQYGAYQLRNSYNNIMAKAIGLTAALTLVASVTIGVVSHHHKIDAPALEHTVQVDILPTPPKVKQPDKAEPPKEAKLAQQQPKANPVSTQRYVPMVVKPDHEVHDEIKPIDPNVAVGPTTVDIPGGDAINAEVGTKDGTGTATAPSDETVYPAGGGLEFMPEPIGGDAAWAKFLQKNLRYPTMAQEESASGKVYVSFIIEKDGHLSDITVLRKAGYGFDEEALRVLKKAPAWKPGVQNGQNVRVRYTIPINFQINQ